MKLAEPINVQIYLTADGKSPFESWLHELRDVEARAKIRNRINRLRLGNFGDSKTVGNGVQELRIDFGPGYRIYFGRQGSALVILLCGGPKKAQDKDIQRAKDLWNEYKERMG